MKNSLLPSLLFHCLLFGFAPHSSAQTSPRIFAEGVISTGDHESHPAFSPDGRMLMFVKMAPDFSKWTLFVSHRRNNGWSQPEIAPFSGQYWDADPFFTKDGKTLYFISNRPAKPDDPPKSDFDIWKVEKGKSGWSNPVPLPPPINSESSEYYPTLTDNGSMYFGSRREGGKGATDIYFSRLEDGEYRTAVNIGEAINTPGNEFEPCIAPDESFLIFMATPTEALDQTDLWISYQHEGQWTKALKLPAPFNSEAVEFSPALSLDGKQFFYDKYFLRRAVGKNRGLLVLMLMPQETINIILALLAFGAFHSLTAATRAKSFVRSLLGERIYLGWYRLLYNVLSLITLAPALYLTAIEPGSMIWSLDATLAAIFKALQLVGIVGLVISLLQIDLLRFFGLKQLTAYFKGEPLPLPDEPLTRNGVREGRKDSNAFLPRSYLPSSCGGAGRSAAHTRSSPANHPLGPG